MRNKCFLALSAVFALAAARADVDATLLGLRLLPSVGGYVVSCAHPSALPKNVVFSWVALDDGVPFAFGFFDGRRLGSGASVTNALPKACMDALEKNRGGVLSLRVRASLTDDGGKTEKKPFAAAQCELRERTARVLEPSVKVPEVETNGLALVIKGREVEWCFDAARGELLSLKTGWLFQHEWLAAPPHPVLPEGLKKLAVKSEPAVVTNGAFAVTTVERWGGGRDSVVAYDVVTRWSFRGDGLLVLQGEIRPAGRDDPAFATGWRFDLDLSDGPLVECFAKRPMLGRGTIEKGIGEVASCYAVTYDAGWDHFSLATGGGPFALTADAKGFFASSGAPNVVGDRRFAFVIHPEKRFVTPRVSSAELPATVRRITVGTLDGE